MLVPPSLFDQIHQLHVDKWNEDDHPSECRDSGVSLPLAISQGKNCKHTSTTSPKIAGYKCNGFESCDLVSMNEWKTHEFHFQQVIYNMMLVKMR